MSNAKRGLVRLFDPLSITDRWWDDIDNTAVSIFDDILFWDEGDKYVIEIDAPGVSKDNIAVTVDRDRFLVVKGIRKIGEEERELWKSVRLPNDANEDKITAQLKDGVLHIKVKKHDRPEIQGKAIKIR